METRQTGDVLAGQDGRLRELLKADWAGNAEPARDRGQIGSATAFVYIQII